MVLMYDGTLATGGHDSCIRLIPEAGPASAPPKGDSMSSAAPDVPMYTPSVDVRFAFRFPSVDHRPRLRLRLRRALRSPLA